MEQRFNEVYVKTYNFVYLRAKSILSKEDAVQQLMKDVYLKMLEEPQIFENSTPYEWLGEQVYKKGCAQFRKRKEREADSLEVPEEEWQRDKEVDQEDTVQVITNHLDDLPDLYHTTLFAFYYDFIPLADIAEYMECTEGVVINRLNYARKYMIKALEDYVDETKVQVAFSVEAMRGALRKWSVEHCMGVTVAQSVYSDICRTMGFAPASLEVEGKEFAGVNHTVVYKEPGNLTDLLEEIALYSKRPKKSPKTLLGLVGILAVIAVVAVCIVIGTSGRKKAKDEPKNPTETQTEQNPAADEPIVDEPVVVEPEVSEYIIPDSNVRELTRADLTGLSKEQLRLARNEIYARHGVIFGVDDLDQYFKTKSWYQPKISVDDFSNNNTMTPIEDSNVMFILSVEKEMS